MVQRLPALVATVDDDVLTGGVGGGGVGEQVEDGAAELGGVGHALHRDHGHPSVVQVGVAVDDVLGQRGGDVARRQGVDADVVLGPLRGQGLDHVDDAGLGHVVGDLGLRVVDDDAGHGPDHHDRAAADAVLDQRSGKRLRDVERAQQVHLHQVLCVGGRVLLCRVVFAVACRVHEVQRVRPERRVHGLAGGLHLLRVGDVARKALHLRNRVRLDPELRGAEEHQLLLRLLQRLHVSVKERHGRLVGKQRVQQRLRKTPAGACDDCEFVCELEVRDSGGHFCLCAVPASLSTFFCNDAPFLIASRSGNRTPYIAAAPKKICTGSRSPPLGGVLPL